MCKLGTRHSHFKKIKTGTQTYIETFGKRRNRRMGSCNLYNMTINNEKKEAMKITRTPSSLDVYVGNTNIRHTREFKYLRSVLMED